MKRNIESELLKKDLRSPKYKVRVVPDKKKLNDKKFCRENTRNYE